MSVSDACMDAIDKASTTLLLKEGEAFNNSVWGISRWGEKLGGHLPKAMGRGRKSQNEAAPCPGRAASCCRRGDLNHVIDVLISWSYDSPMALTPRLFREKQPLGLCCGLRPTRGTLSPLCPCLPRLAGGAISLGTIEATTR